MEHPWLTHLKRLHALAESGLAFVNDEFDKERYEEIALLSRTMLEDLCNIDIQTLGLVLSNEVKRYVTPQVAVRGAVFKGDKILLVKEKMDGLWTLPGGYADVGLSAVENVEKEVWEEAGLTVSVDKLYALRHKAKGDYDPDVREFYILFFLCQHEGDYQVATGPETTDVGFFGLDEIPALSTSRVIMRDIQDSFAANNAGKMPSILDK